MTTGELQFAAFLSYSRKDERLARWLVRSLEEFGLPRQTVDDLKARRAPFLAARPIFRDVHDMPVGGVISKRLVEVLDGSGAMIVLCTPASAGSAWVNEEVQRFAALHPNRRIIPAVAEGEPETDECYPPALLALGKPLAADLRRPGERRQAVVKIAAAVLGLDVDQLVGRVQKRRAEQVRWLAVGGGAAAAAVVGLAVTAGVMADRARVEAERASEQIMHLLTKTRVDMKDLASKQALHEAAQIYFDSKAGQRLSDKDLLLKAEWLRQEGIDAGKREETKESLGHLQEAYAATGELLKRGPDNPEFLFSHSQSAFYVGDHYFQRGKLDDVRDPWETYRTVAEHLLAVAPDYPGARLEVHYSRVNIGVLELNERRDARAAAEAFRGALEIIGSDAADVDAKLNLSRTWLQYVDALAQFAPAQDVLAAARKWEPLLRELETSGDVSNDIQFHLANAWDRILAAEKRSSAASRNIDEAKIQDLARDPDNLRSTTFAVEMSLPADKEPDCRSLSGAHQLDLAKSLQLRLVEECLPGMTAKEQLAYCSAFSGALPGQPDLIDEEPTWARVLTACSLSARKSRNADLSRSLEDVAAQRFFNRNFDELRLWTQVALAGFRTTEANAWITNLNASLDSRGWINRGDD